MKVKVGYDIYSSGSEFKKHFRYIIHLSKVGTYEVGSPLYNIFIPIADQLKELQGVKVDKMRVENHKNSKRKTLFIIDDNGNENLLKYWKYPNDITS